MMNREALGSSLAEILDHLPETLSFSDKLLQHQARRLGTIRG